MSHKKSHASQDEVEAWCKTNGVQLSRTWGECSCLWIEPRLYKIDPEKHNDGDMREHTMACAACCPTCKHCGRSYVEDPSLPEDKNECDASSCERDEEDENE